MVESTTVAITPATHAERHSVGGIDPLIDPIITSGHHASHEAGGSDQVSIQSYKPDTTIVFNGTSPTAWTDLDLSAVVGAKTALVLLGVSLDGDYNHYFMFRRNGDTEDYNNTSQSINVAYQTAGGVDCLILVETDSNGIVEWRSDTAAATHISMRGFIG